MPSWLQIRNADTSVGPVEMLIYEQIGKDWWDGSGVEAKAFAEELAKVPKDREITVAINSPGGNVWDGLAIYHQLQARKQKVTCRVDGIAASIASVIAMAGRETVMPENALMMIHNPYGIAMGDAATLRKTADELDSHKAVLVGIYADKSGMARDEISKLMDQETWFNGTEAKDRKLCDRTTGEVSLAAKFDLSRFRRVPAGVTGGITPPPSEQTTTKGSTMETVIPTPKAEASPSPAAPEIKPPQNAIDPAEFNRLKDALAGERRKRISNELNSLAAQRDLDPADWLDQCIADEAVLAKLAKLPTRGAGPVGASVSNQGNPLIEKFRAMKPGKERQAFMVENHAELGRRHQEFAPQGSNTLSATLVPAYLSDGLIIAVHNRLGMLDAFTAKFSNNTVAPRSTVLVSKVTAGPTVQTNATNFESGDSTLAAVSVTMSQLTSSFHLDNDALNQGFRLAQLSEYAGYKLADAISDVVTALLVVGTTEANGFGATTAIGAAASFDSADLAPIYALAKNFTTKSLVIDGGHLAYLIPTDRTKFGIGENGAYGFDRIIENNRWTSAVSNCVGFITDRFGIAVASGLPVEMPRNQFDSMSTQDVKNGLTVQTVTWYNTATRITWGSHDVVFGAQVGNGAATGALRLLVTS